MFVCCFLFYFFSGQEIQRADEFSIFVFVVRPFADVRIQIVRETLNHQFIIDLIWLFVESTPFCLALSLLYKVLKNDPLDGQINKRIKRTHQHQNTIWRSLSFQLVAEIFQRRRREPSEKRRSDERAHEHIHKANVLPMMLYDWLMMVCDGLRCLHRIVYWGSSVRSKRSQRFFIVYADNAFMRNESLASLFLSNKRDDTKGKKKKKKSGKYVYAKAQCVTNTIAASFNRTNRRVSFFTLFYSVLHRLMSGGLCVFAT